ncbi:MAG: hypothetical protein FJ278_08535 [Planctomycetes bacterium]|nr:hypothetical protein [Planctomycetota bacterium]
MAYRIEKTEDLIEVHLSGQVDEWEILAILGKLRDMAPRKETSDVWLLGEECVVRWDAFSMIVDGIKRLLPPDLIPSRSAIVVASPFQMAQAEMYRQEAKSLPYETGAFMTREEAVRWLRSKDVQSSAPASEVSPGLAT